MGAVNVLVVTGPMNASQLGAAAYPWRKPTRIFELQGAGIHSYDYAAAMQSFASGGFRAAIKRRVLGANEALGDVGMCWFSAGHGAARLLCHAEGPEVLDQWLALDGLYGPWKTPVPWALRVAKAAAHRRTALVATASTTTPGQYGDCLTSWTNVARELGIAAGGNPLGGFPDADPVYRKGSFCVMGYPSIGHHGQVPAMGKAMCAAFDRGWSGRGISAALNWLLHTTPGKLTLALSVVGAAGVAGRMAGRL